MGLHYGGTAAGLSAAPGADGIRKILWVSKAGRRVQREGPSSQEGGDSGVPAELLASTWAIPGWKGAGRPALAKSQQRLVAAQDIPPSAAVPPNMSKPGESRDGTNVWSIEHPKIQTGSLHLPTYLLRGPQEGVDTHQEQGNGTQGSLC